MISLLINTLKTKVIDFTLVFIFLFSCKSIMYLLGTAAVVAVPLSRSDSRCSFLRTDVRIDRTQDFIVMR